MGLSEYFITPVGPASAKASSDRSDDVKIGVMEAVNSIRRDLISDAWVLDHEFLKLRLNGLFQTAELKVQLRLEDHLGNVVSDVVYLDVPYECTSPDSDFPYRAILQEVVVDTLMSFLMKLEVHDVG